MRNRGSRVWKQSLWVLALVCCFSACRRDENSTLGDGLSDWRHLGEHYQDTAFDIVLYSVPDTGLIVQNAARMLLGSINDEVFGRADFHVYSQLSYDGSNTPSGRFVPGEDGNGEVDSVVLVLPYSGLYPTSYDATATRVLRLKIHELSQDLVNSAQEDSVYTVSSSVDYLREAFGEVVELHPRPFDSVRDTNSGTSYIPALRVRLDKRLGQRLMSQPSAAYEEANEFSQYFKGLCLRSEAAPSSNASAAVSFRFGIGNIGDEVARIEVYHGLVADDTARYSQFSFSPVRFTKVERDYSQAESDLRAQLSQGDSTAGSRAAYILSSGGAYLGCRLPNIRKLFEGKRIIINRAYLVLNAASNDRSSIMSPPSSLQIPLSLDDAFRQEGTYNADKKEYRLLLTRYLQHLFYAEAEPEPFFIHPSTTERYGMPCAIKLNGPHPGNGSPIKLELIYTEVKE